MASTGNVFPGAGENNAGIGATAWTNPGNILSDNATDASCNAAASSQYLVARNFNFASVPANATIMGVTVRIEASESSTGSETLNARLQNASAALTGNGKTASINGTSKIVYTYGSTSDVWGATLTPAIIHDPDFGVRFWFTTAHAIAVDFVTMAIEYTVPGPGIATETDTALALAPRKVLAVGLATETDTAFALAPVVSGGGQQLPVGLATETDVALALAPVKRLACGLATESDTALALGARKVLPCGMATETDVAFALARAAAPDVPGEGDPEASCTRTSYSRGMRLWRR